jgi:NADPH:quinone reductase-like Zn-dependent oxidoreductase
VEKGQIQPVVDGPYRFDRIPDLIQYFGEAKHSGKVVVDFEK